MASKIGDLYWEVDANTTKFEKGLKSTDKEATKFGKTLSTLSKVGVAGFVAAAVVGIGKVSKELIVAASEAEETRNKFNVTFRDVRDEADATAEALADGFGLSKQASEDLLSSTGDLLAGFGFAGEEALALSADVNTLAGDLSSFQNVDIKQASDAITKALLGEREALKSLGIAITEADLKRLAEEEGITGELDRQTKAALTFKLALSQSGNAVGDFARSADSYANRLRVAKSATEDLSAELGRFLLPAASETVGVFGRLTKAVAEYVKERNDARDLEAVAFGDTKGSLEEQQAAFEDTLEKLADVNKELEGMNELNMASFAIERSLKKEYEEALSNLSERIDREKALLSQQKAAARELLESQKREAAAEELKARRDQAALSAAEELKQIYFDSLEPMEREAALLSEQIEYWKQFEDITEVAELIAKLERDRAEILGTTSGIMGELGTNSSMYYDTAIDNSERLAEVQDAEAERLELLQGKYESLATTGFTAVTDGISAMSEALVAGEDGWDAFAKSGLNSIAAVLEALSAQLVAQAAAIAASFFLGNVASVAGVGPALLGAGVASASAGALRGLAGSFEQGGIVPEIPGVPATGDNMLARVNPGEEIRPKDEAGQSMSFVFQFSDDVFAKAVVDNVNSGQNLIDLSRGAYNG